MKDTGTEPDPDTVREERESFVVLQHVYTLTEADPRQSLPCARFVIDLGFLEERCSELVEYLIRTGYLAWATPGLEVSITQQGIEYIERLARRRRSVRNPPA